MCLKSFPSISLVFQTVVLHRFVVVLSSRKSIVIRIHLKCVPLQDPLKNKSIFSGGLFQYLEESKKWRSRYLYVGETYNIGLYESKAVSGNR